MSVFTLRGIQKVDGNVYDVFFAGGGQEVVFQMVVVEAEFTFLERGSDFISFIGDDPRDANPIYEAVFKFHDATRVDVVSSEE